MSGTFNSVQKSQRFRQSAMPFIGPLLLLLVVGFNIPVLLIFKYSLCGPQGLTVANYESLVTTPVFIKVVANTFRITIITTLVVAIFGYVLAYWITGLTSRSRNVALALVILPFWVSVLVRTYAWIVVLGNAGLVNRLLQWSGLTVSPVAFLYNDLGVTIGMANIQLPLLVLPLYAAMIRIDKRHLQAAASLGASDRVIFWRVFFPQTVPALLSGVMLVVILCLGFYVTPAILGGGRVPMVANMLDTYINSIPKWELASAVSIVLLILTLVLFGIYRRLDARATGHV
ncbi:ABC transporter permease [Mesorhizobium sp. M7A.F.Ca.US.006.01.1.1]|uniref:ABC transporter permease n=1 Tax=Mesorhizobium sp. M7A.F.Ca.US.006.01.1.1 TaxID=2496707 RepID=UPI000FCBB2C8|nr:ABC transporter permease [Mesorhizobium sp. M7A.F.Ca.US.006.01.1.1]RUZ75996.1 ABC transporter permease [Mesorhizobium sp. M7A.F.Ca.US.006.01.1.1]